MQRMINQIGGQMDNLELRDKLYVSEFPVACSMLSVYSLWHFLIVWLAH